MRPCVSDHYGECKLGVVVHVRQEETSQLRRQRYDVQRGVFLVEVVRDILQYRPELESVAVHAAFLRQEDVVFVVQSAEETDDLG